MVSINFLTSEPVPSAGALSKSASISADSNAENQLSAASNSLSFNY